jgi:hypothetical protein
MDVRDGFITGIHDYCDRWCGRCPLTTRCRLFATFGLRGFKEDQRSSAKRPSSEPGLSEAIREMFEDQRALDETAPTLQNESLGSLPPDLEPSPGVGTVVRANRLEIRRRMAKARRSSLPIQRAVQTIDHFMILVPMKMMRALAAVARHGPGDRQSDANGSGKVALLGLEQMRESWQRLVETAHMPAELAAPFLEEIARLERNLRRAVPDARQFVRPGFDEMDTVRMRDAGDRMH